MKGFLRLISRHPVIVLRSYHLGELVDAILPEEPTFQWVLIPKVQFVDEILRWEAARRQRRPQDTAIYFCTDKLVYRQLRDEREVHVSWAALESFVDERQFKGFRPAVEPEYDAVMVSRDLRVKRQELAAKVSRLLMIMPHIATPSAEKGQIDELREKMGTNATFLLDDNQPITRKRLAMELKRARVGLTLSAQEGVNRTCYEYQLAGLPVVSTSNIGGRNQFLDPDTSMVVPADPDAVAAAVKELCGRNLAPQLVRQKVMDKLRAHRGEIIRLGQQHWSEKGRHEDFGRHLYGLAETKPLVVSESVDGKLAELAKVLRGPR